QPRRLHPGQLRPVSSLGRSMGGGGGYEQHVNHPRHPHHHNNEVSSVHPWQDALSTTTHDFSLPMMLHWRGEEVRGHLAIRGSHHKFMYCYPADGDLRNVEASEIVEICEQKIEKKQMKSARVSNRVPERESEGERGRVRGERSRDQVNKRLPRHKRMTRKVEEVVGVEVEVVVVEEESPPPVPSRPPPPPSTPNHPALHLRAHRRGGWVQDVGHDLWSVSNRSLQCPGYRAGSARLSPAVLHSDGPRNTRRSAEPCSLEEEPRASGGGEPIPVMMAQRKA
ncbi:unnamed protein product, partial [Gadus morhua 'NCC']